MKQWMVENLGISEAELVGTVVILGVCLLMWFLTALKRKSAFLTGCIIRMGSGIGTILAANYMLAQSGFSVAVGIGPISLLTSAILGIPGVCVLYGILLM